MSSSIAHNLVHRLGTKRAITCPKEEYRNLVKIALNFSKIERVRRLFSRSRQFLNIDFQSACNPPANDKTYLEFGEATITNNDFHSIACTENLDAWMSGETIDMALEILKQERNCVACGIDIANSNHSQVFYFASKLEDAANKEYDIYRTRFKDKRWIFVVINDAIGSIESENTVGSHWSLIVLDRTARTVYYFDSLTTDLSLSSEAGWNVGKSLLLILQEDLNGWQFSPEYDSPDQVENNLFKKDVGPCGPFVIKMADWLIDSIQLFQKEGKEDSLSLELPLRFGVEFEHEFNSQHVQWDI